MPHPGQEQHYQETPERPFSLGSQHSQLPEKKGATSKTSNVQQPGSPSVTLSET